jgi:hypothetical protein
MDNPLTILWIAIPLTLQTLLIFGLTYVAAKWLKFSYEDAAPSAMIGASNHFEVAIATAVMLFGLNSGAALATVVGVLIEVPSASSTSVPGATNLSHFASSFPGPLGTSAPSNGTHESFPHFTGLPSSTPTSTSPPSTSASSCVLPSSVHLSVNASLSRVDVHGDRAENAGDELRGRDDVFTRRQNAAGEDGEQADGGAQVDRADLQLLLAEVALGHRREEQRALRLGGVEDERARLHHRFLRGVGALGQRGDLPDGLAEGALGSLLGNLAALDRRLERGGRGLASHGV